MNYDLRRPCPECPFNRQGGVRLYGGRIIEIALPLIVNTRFEFPCHKTVDYDDEEDDEGNRTRKNQDQEQHCAGAMIFVEKNDPELYTRRMIDRPGYDPKRLDMTADVFDDIEEMLTTRLDAEDER